jgi:hypothetical protein
MLDMCAALEPLGDNMIDKIHATAQGGLRHQYHGAYTAVVALLFANDEAAEGALKTLGAPWKRGKATAITAVVDRAGLDDLKEALEAYDLKITKCGRKDCGTQCQYQDIDGCPHSIDFGPTFSVRIPYEDPRQQRLL